MSEEGAATCRGEDKEATGDAADTTHTQGDVGHSRGDDEGVDDEGDGVRAQTGRCHFVLGCWRKLARR